MGNAVACAFYMIIHNSFIELAYNLLINQINVKYFNMLNKGRSLRPTESKGTCKIVGESQAAW